MYLKKFNILRARKIFIIYISILIFTFYITGLHFYTLTFMSRTYAVIQRLQVIDIDISASWLDQRVCENV